MSQGKENQGGHLSTRRVLTAPKSNPELERLLEESAKRPMTAEERIRQRASWVRGNLGLMYPEKTNDEIEEIIRKADPEFRQVEQIMERAKVLAAESAVEERRSCAEVAQEFIEHTEDEISAMTAQDREEQSDSITRSRLARDIRDKILARDNS